MLLRLVVAGQRGATSTMEVSGADGIQPNSPITCGETGWWLTRNRPHQVQVDPPDEDPHTVNLAGTEHFLLNSVLSWHCLRRNATGMTVISPDTRPALLEEHFGRKDPNHPSVIAGVRTILTAMADAGAVSLDPAVEPGFGTPPIGTTPGTPDYSPNFWGELIAFVGLFQSIHDSAEDYANRDLDDPSPYLSVPPLSPATGAGFLLRSAFEQWRRRARPAGSGNVFSPSPDQLAFAGWVFVEQTGPELPDFEGVSGVFSPVVAAALPPGKDAQEIQIISISDAFPPYPGPIVGPQPIGPAPGSFAPIDGSDLLPFANPNAGTDWDATLHQLNRAVTAMYHAGYSFTVADRLLIVNRLWAWRVPTCAAAAYDGSVTCDAGSWPESVQVPAEPDWPFEDPSRTEVGINASDTKLCLAPVSTVPSFSLNELAGATAALIQSGCAGGLTSSRSRQLLRNILQAVAYLYREGHRIGDPEDSMEFAGWAEADPKPPQPGDSAPYSFEGGSGMATASIFPALVILRLCQGVVPDYEGPFSRAPYIQPVTNTSMSGLTNFLHILSAGRVAEILSSFQWNAAHSETWRI